MSCTANASSRRTAASPSGSRPATYSSYRRDSAAAGKGKRVSVSSSSSRRKPTSARSRPSSRPTRTDRRPVSAASAWYGEGARNSRRPAAVPDEGGRAVDSVSFDIDSVADGQSHGNPQHEFYAAVEPDQRDSEGRCRPLIRVWRPVHGGDGPDHASSIDGEREDLVRAACRAEPARRGGEAAAGLASLQNYRWSGRLWCRAHRVASRTIDT